MQQRATYKIEREEFTHGSYGKIFKAIDHIGKPLIVKKIEDLFENPLMALRILREIKTLKRLKGHPNIISLEDIIQPDSEKTFDSLSLVFEKMETNFEILFASEKVLTEVQSKYVLFQLLCGVHYSHSAGIIHRDLKPANLLINEDCSLKICDYNLARAVNIKFKEMSLEVKSENDSDAMPAPPTLSRQKTKYVMTRWLRAPEVILGNGNYDLPVDMWSVGCIFAQILLMQPKMGKRKYLFPGSSTPDQLRLIFDLLGAPTEEDLAAILPPEGVGPYLKKLNELSYKPKTPGQIFQGLKKLFPIADEQALDFLQRCLVINPNKRITAAEALQHPFLASVRNGNENLTFPLRAISPSDQASYNEYYDFEVKLMNQKKQGQEADSAEIRKLMWKEIKRYHPAITSPAEVKQSTANPHANAPSVAAPRLREQQLPLIEEEPSKESSKCRICAVM